MEQKTIRDKVWIFESIRNLKGVGHLSKDKMNELRIHTIADIQVNARHHGIPKLPIQGFRRIYDISLQAIPGNPPSYFKGFIYFKIWRDMGGQTEVFYYNVKIMLHQRPNSFHD